MTLHGHSPLKQRVLNAGLWVFAGHGFSLVLRFGSSLLMTRLLMPEMFGVMTIATMAIVGLAMLSDIGLKQSVIRSERGDDATFLNTVWTIQVIRGFSLWLCAEAIALVLLVAARYELLPKGTAYTDPNLPPVVAILAFTALIAGFQSTKLFQQSRKLFFGRIATVEAASQLLGLLVMIGWALFHRSIWALVVGNICTIITVVLLSHVWLPGVPGRLRWETAARREITSFGKWIFVSSILGFFVNNGDRLMLGAMVDTTILGVYVIAFSIFSLAEQLLSRIVSEVSYPALSEVVRDRRGELKLVYYKFHVPIGSFVLFCSGALMMSGEGLIALLYDSRYRQAGWILQVLAIALMTVPYRLAEMSMLSLGLSKSLSQIAVTRLFVLFIATPVCFYFFGFPGALVGIVLSYFAVLPQVFLYKFRYDLFDLRKESLLLVGWLVGAFVGSIVTKLISYWVL